MILSVASLRIKKLEERKGVNRPFSIDSVSFDVASGDLILFAGSPGAGKTALKSALVKQATVLAGTVKYGDGITPRDVNGSSDLLNDLGPQYVIIKDGFQTRLNCPSDNLADDHWQLFKRVRFSGATFIAFTEIERLAGWRPGTFSRVVILREGAIFADGQPATVGARLTEQLRIQDNLFRPEDSSVLLSWAAAP